MTNPNKPFDPVECARDLLSDPRAPKRYGIKGKAMTTNGGTLVERCLRQAGHADYEPYASTLREAATALSAQQAELEALRNRTYSAFFNEVCRRAEAAMLKSHKLEGMHYMAMKELKAEWDALGGGK